jgi:enoyl-CoA hydratase/carnithine racemase
MTDARPQEPLLVERPEPTIALVRFNRPDRLNAMDGDLMDRLAATWHSLARDPDLRCVVVTGNGRGFCAGADAGFLSDERGPRGAGMDGELSMVPGRLLDVPVIVAVNGVCAGGGLHYVADADIVIASTAASFLDPHVSVGQVSGIEPPSLALRLPLSVITRMAILGSYERIGARRAYELGLVSELTEPEDLVPRALELARAVARNSPSAVASTRRVVRHLMDELVEPSMRLGWERVQAHWSHPDATEGPAAFTERRDADWGPRRQ